MQNPRQLLPHWFVKEATIELHEIKFSGLSGARIWQIRRAGQAFALRQWPDSISSGRLKPIHDFQYRLASAACPVPAPIKSSAGATFVAAHDHLWELTPWMPGEADFRSDPQPTKLYAALVALARLHVAEAATHPEGSSANRPSASPALVRRAARLDDLLRTELAALQACVDEAPLQPMNSLASRALDLIARSAPQLCHRSFRWRDEQLPQQWCLRDIKHDHILFTEGTVTGIIDFGAASVDSPAGDVARLLGSMALDDRERWKHGLAAYESVRPLSSAERDAVDYFDSSGTVLSAANWLHWLFRDNGIQSGKTDRVSAADRLEELVGRLQVLAASS
jgi:Ser/Thr protein kinase RdoA (MazF antagonist)